MGQKVLSSGQSSSTINMMSSRSTLQIRRFVVFTLNGTRAYDETFHPGVNIIRGRNSSGKSTIMNLLYYSLGGDYTSWSQAALRCSTVVVEVSLNDVVATLKRSISQATQRPMQIYMGKIDEALKSSGDGWKQFPYKQSDNTFSFSRVLFDLLKYPEVKSDAGDTNITMHQILRLMFIDQESPTDWLFRFTDFDNPLTREAISELLLGIYDNDLYTLRLKEKNLTAVKKDKESEYKGLRRLYQNSTDTIDIAKADGLIAAKNEELSKLEEVLTERSRQTTYTIPRKKNIDVVGKIEALNKLKLEIYELKSKAERVDEDIEDSKMFIESLQNKLEQINDSILTRKSLGDLPLTHCPQCLSPLQPTDEEGICSLCHQPINEDLNKSYASRIQQEIKIQISESQKLLESKDNKSRLYKKDMMSRLAVAEQLQRDINLSTKNSKPVGQEELEKLYERRGALKQELIYLQKQKYIAERFKQLGEEIANIEKDLTLIRQQIETHETQQLSNRQKAMRKIQEFTAFILRKDLPRQDEFKNANYLDIDVNFKANSMALKGQFNYSASSNVYLKNAVRFAIFYASMALDFFRYPAFIACDNMEDKGMEEERSQNFQKLLVEMCKKIPKDSYQMIFSTSMIAPELNTNDYCIGSEYTDEKKSLTLR